MPALNDLLPLFARGERLTADWVNTVSRHLNGVSNVGDVQAALTVGQRQFRSNSGKRQVEPDIVLVRNDSGADVTGYHPVLGLGGAVKLPSDSETVVTVNPIAFSGEMPAAGHTGKFVVLLGPVHDGEWQLGVVSGVTWVKVSGEGDYADVAVGETGFLECGDAGSGFVLWVGESDGDGLKWAVVRLSNPSGGESGGGSSEFPEGTGECNCNHCVEGQPMPASSTECCNGHPALMYVDPTGVPRVFQWVTGNTWATAEFDGTPCEVEAADESACTGLGGTWDSDEEVCTIANVYQDVMTVDADAAGSSIERVLVTDNDCPIECFRYEAIRPFRCQCDNEFEKVKYSEEYSSDDLSCKVCVKPDSALGSGDPVQLQCGSSMTGTLELLGAARATLSGFSGRYPPNPYPSECGVGTSCYVTLNGEVPITNFGGMNVNGTFGMSSAPPAGGFSCRWMASTEVGTRAVFSSDPERAANGLPDLAPALMQICSYVTCNETAENGTKMVVRVYANVSVQATGPQDLCSGATPIHLGSWRTSYEIDLVDGVVPAEAVAAVLDGDHALTLFVPSLHSTSACATALDAAADLGDITLRLYAAAGPGAPRGDGSCSGCTQGTAPTDPSAGSCCVDGECLEYVSEAECAEFDRGVWHASLAACQADCDVEVKFYCNNGECESTLPGDSGDTEYDTLEECQQNCVVGACCNDDDEDGIPTCTSATEVTCNGLTNSVFMGAGTLCNQFDCGEDITGACCCGNGGCANGVPWDQCDPADCLSDCSFNGGCVEFHPNEDCGDVTCEEPAATGACCEENIGSGMCECSNDVTEGDCSGVWYGEGTTCAGSGATCPGAPPCTG
jgi:hypothetical protein